MWKALFATGSPTGFSRPSPDAPDVRDAFPMNAKSKYSMKTKTQWVDYKDLKSKVNVSDVLRHFGIDVPIEKGNQIYLPCPLPGHAGDGDNPNAFSANTEKNAWRCLTHCGSGNVIDLFCRLGGEDPADKGVFRSSALRMMEVFCGGNSIPDTRPTSTTQKPKTEPKPTEPNPKLGIDLKVKHDVPFLLDEKKIDEELLREFGIGYCSKGMFNGRVVIPIHNWKGELVAYAGRGLKDADIRKRGKYLFPKAFHKSQELFNFHRAQEQVAEHGLVIVVEGFFAALRWHQAGYPAVAIMGCEISDTQVEILSRLSVKVWLMLDNDEAGRAAQAKMASKLARHVFVRILEYPNPGQDSEPEDFTPEELDALLRW